MPIRINTIACWLLAVLLAAPWLAPAAFADTEDPRAAAERRWTPGLAFWSGVTIQNQDAAVSARCATGGPAGTFGPNQVVLPACSRAPFGGPANLRPPQANDEDVVSPLVGSSLQLMTPTLEFIPFRPRIFGSVEFITYYSPERKIAREGAPSGVRPPRNIDFPDPGNKGFPAISLGGVGSQTSSEVQWLGYGAKLGVAFPFELWGRRLWIKPAAGWTRYEVDVKGIVIHGIKDDLNAPLPEWGSNVRSIELLGSDSLVLNGIGPGAELELEAVRIGPLGANVFFDLHAYRLFGDRNVEITSTQSLPRQPIFGVPLIFGADTYTADWSWEADPWLWRTVAGIRLQWLGR